MTQVQHDYGGDLVKALAAASKIPQDTPKTVVLGSAAYQLTGGITVPANTTMQGKGPDLTMLVFTIKTGTSLQNFKVPKFANLLSN